MGVRSGLRVGEEPWGCSGEAREYPIDFRGAACSSESPATAPEDVCSGLAAPLMEVSSNNGLIVCAHVQY